MLFFVLLFCNAIGGLMRDIFTHKITTPEHWQMLMLPTVYTRAELDYDVVVGNDTVVTPSYDPHCDPAASQITGGCEPVAVISAENLRNGNIGKQETALIGQVLQSDQRMGQYVIAQDGKFFVHPCFLLLRLKGFTICLTPTFFLTRTFTAWDCIWGELIQNGKGLKVSTISWLRADCSDNTTISCDIYSSLLPTFFGRPYLIDPASLKATMTSL